VNLKHLETYHYFCRYLCMTRTAEHLHVSQPAVSQQLRCFEEECGVKLFYRESGQYKLTEVGEAVFLISKRVFSRLQQIEGVLEIARRPASRRLRIGSTKAYARTLMPDLVAQFQKQYPDVQVSLSEGNSADLLVRLRNRKEDVVVVARKPYDSSFKPIPFARAEFVLVARPDHPLAKAETVSMTALTGEQLIIREQGSGSREAILSKLKAYDANPSVMVESESLSFILGFIQRRMALSFILLHEIENELASGNLKQVNLLEGGISFEADIVTLRGEPMSAPVRWFLKIAKKRREAVPTNSVQAG
jgi:DNA-binding transcriptional LysR family regulator